MNISFRTAVLAGVLAVFTAGAVEAQVWRGLGRLAGKVVDESGKPIVGATVSGTLESDDGVGPTSTTNEKGEWAIAGIAGGNWTIEFSKEGYETRALPVRVSEYSRLPPRDVVLTKKVVVVDPNEVIREKMLEAAALMNAKKYAEARTIYESLFQQYPEVPQFEPLIARAYYGEGNREKAIEHLRSAAAKDPANIEVSLLLGNLLMEDGKTEEGRKVLESIDESRVTDPAIYLNVGIGLINDGKHEDAVPWFDKAIARFPDHPDAYYYRGVSKLAVGDEAAAKTDLEKFVTVAAPDAPELAMAKKILDSIKS